MEGDKIPTYQATFWAILASDARALEITWHLAIVSLELFRAGDVGNSLAASQRAEIESRPASVAHSSPNLQRARPLGYAKLLHRHEGCRLF